MHSNIQLSSFHDIGALHRDAKDSKEDKDKDRLVLNYSYFVPDRSDRLGTPAQRMTLPSKQGETTQS